MRTIGTAGRVRSALFLIAAACVLSCGASPQEETGKAVVDSTAYSLDLATRLLGVKERGVFLLPVTVSRKTDMPREKIWSFWQRLDGWPEWGGPLVISTRWEGEPGWRTGHRFEKVVNLGFPLGTKTFRGTVGVVVPAESVIWWEKEGNIESCHVLLFEGLPGGGTRITATEVFARMGSGWPRWFLLWRLRARYGKYLDGLINGVRLG